MLDSIKVREIRLKQTSNKDDMEVLDKLSAKVSIGKVYESKQYCTYYCERIADAGGAHDIPYREVVTFDKLTGKQLKYNDIFNTEYNQELSEMLVDAWTKQKYSTGDYIENMSDYVSGISYNIDDNLPRLMVDTNVGLLKDCIVFIYQPYELGCFAEGFFTFLMPYDKAKKYMSITLNQ